MKNFIITGTSSGIGNAVALQLNNKDFHLYLLGIQLDKLTNGLTELASDFYSCTNR